MTSLSPIAAELRMTRNFRTPEEEAVVALFKTVEVVREVLDRVIAPAGITGQQYNVLRILRGAGERGLPILTIAERMIERAPGITKLVDRLERKRFVKRLRCTEDRRRIYCVITPDGLALLRGLDTALTTADRRLLSGLGGAKITTLTRLLNAVRKGARDSARSNSKKEKRDV